MFQIMPSCRSVFVSLGVLTFFAATACRTNSGKDSNSKDQLVPSSDDGCEDVAAIGELVAKIPESPDGYSNAERVEQQLALLTVLSCRVKLALNTKNSYERHVKAMEDLQKSSQKTKNDGFNLTTELPDTFGGPTWDQLVRYENDLRDDTYRQIQLESSINSNLRNDYLKLDSQRLQQFQTLHRSAIEEMNSKAELQGKYIRNGGEIVKIFGERLKNDEQAIKNQILDLFRQGYGQYVQAYTSYTKLYQNLNATVARSLVKVRRLQSKIDQYEKQIDNCLSVYDGRVKQNLRQALSFARLFEPKKSVRDRKALRDIYKAYSSYGELGEICYSYALVDNFMEVWDRSSSLSRYRANPLLQMPIHRDVKKFSCMKDDRVYLEGLFGNLAESVDASGPTVELELDSSRADWVSDTKKDLELLATGSMFVLPSSSRTELRFPPIVSLLQVATIDNVDIDTELDAKDYYAKNTADNGAAFAGCDKTDADLFDTYVDGIRDFEITKHQEWGQFLRNWGVPFQDPENFRGMLRLSSDTRQPYVPASSPFKAEVIFHRVMEDANTCLYNVAQVSTGEQVGEGESGGEKLAMQIDHVKELPEGAAVTIGEKSFNFFAPQLYISESKADKNLSNSIKQCIDSASQSMVYVHQFLGSQKDFTDFYMQIRKDTTPPKTITPYFTSPVPNANYY